MDIAMITIGSRGDIQPFLALGQALCRRGHHLGVAAFPRFREDVEKLGFSFFPIRGDEDRMMKLLIGDGVSGIAYMNGLTALLNRNKREILDDVYDACRGADLILYTFLGSLAYHAAESLKIPCMRVNFWPADRTGDNPMPGMPALPLGRWYNRLTYDLSGVGFSIFTNQELNGWRAGLGLSKWAGRSYRTLSGRPVETLCAYSEVLAPRPKEWGEHLHLTGFWFLEERAAAPVEKGLLRFLENGDPPIYIGFGSMVGGSFAELQDIVLESLKSTGQRAVLSSGWRKFDAAGLPPNVYGVDAVPHGWLFPRVKAVVHHGGAGTTAAGLRAGKPTLVVYFGGDQQFWGNRVYRAGAGPRPLARKGLTAKRFTRALELLEDARLRQNAARIARRLAQEDGCENACDVIEAYMTRFAV
ncbi:glycosyltransferase [Caproiciproducens sp. NJN-50]|uniref:glycosyltransferase n=1 Tax=Caproiciproducens sp. NJN-50 TaxID=2507162 RepID=UPI0013E8E950|nr:glycosyltransferase [Caproiciproducens sp. NJN-50]